MEIIINIIVGIIKIIFIIFICLFEIVSYSLLYLLKSCFKSDKENDDKGNYNDYNYNEDNSCTEYNTFCKRKDLNHDNLKKKDDIFKKDNKKNEISYLFDIPKRTISIDNKNSIYTKKTYDNKNNNFTKKQYANINKNNNYTKKDDDNKNKINTNFTKKQYENIKKNNNYTKKDNDNKNTINTNITKKQYDYTYNNYTKKDDDKKDKKYIKNIFDNNSDNKENNYNSINPSNNNIFNNFNYINTIHNNYLIHPNNFSNYNYNYKYNSYDNIFLKPYNKINKFKNKYDNEKYLEIKTSIDKIENGYMYELPDIKNRLLVLDTEVTGKNEYDRIIEICAREMINGLLTGKKFHSYFKPKLIMSNYSIRRHKVPKIAFKYNSEDEKIFLQKFLKFQENSIIIAHNAKYDMEKINKELEYHDLPKINIYKYRCSMRIFLQKYPSISNKFSKLKECCDFFKIKYNSNNLHTAIYDSYLLGKIIEKKCMKMN